MPFVGCCALVYFWTLRFSRIGDFYTLRLGFFGNLDLRIIDITGHGWGGMCENALQCHRVWVRGG